MTEAESNNYEIITEDFNGKDIEFIKEEDKVWISTRAIANGLEMDKDNVLQIFSNNKDLLNSHSTTMKIIALDNKRRAVRVFDKTAFIWIAVRSNSPKAIPFQEWTINIIDEVVNKGRYIETVEDLNEYDILVKTAILLKEQNEKIRLIENQVNSVDSELKEFEQKYDDEKIITPQARRKIKDLIAECVKNSGMHWNNFWPKIWKTFGITTTTDISEKLGQKIIKWIKINPFFEQYLNDNEEV